MRQKSFRKHLNPRDVNNPLDDYLKKVSLESEIEKSLLLPCGTMALDGISLGLKTIIPTMCIFGIYSRFLEGMGGERSG